MSNTKIDVTYWHLTYDDDAVNSHKFYDVYVVGNDAILRWGRVGTNGQYSTEQYRSTSQSDNAARSQVNRKLSNGYELKLNERVSVESNYLDPYDLASKVEHALRAHEKPAVLGNRLAVITEAANEIASATGRKATAGLLTSWNSLQREWEEIAIEYQHAEAAMKAAEQVITQRLLGI
jgi:predicted DNA-binding WGR domain protein